MSNPAAQNVILNFSFSGPIATFRAENPFRGPIGFKNIPTNFGTILRKLSESLKMTLVIMVIMAFWDYYN